MSSIFGNVVDGLKKLMQALQAIEPAPNETTVMFNDTVLCMNPLQNGVAGTLGADILQLDNNGESVLLNSNEVAYTPVGGPTVNIPWIDVINPPIPNLDEVLAEGNTSDTQIIITDGGVSAQTTIGNYQIFMSNNSGNSIEINNDALQQWILMYNGSMTANYLANEVNYFDNATSQTVMFYRHYEMSINNEAVDFAFNSTAKRFYKWKAAQSFLVDRNDSHIERWHSFKVSEGGVNFSFNSFNEYLDTDGKDGWTVILSNSDGSAIQVTTPDIYFYSHNTGMQISPFPLNKYATARFTLVELPSYPMGYAWAVSMY